MVRSVWLPTIIHIVDDEPSVRKAVSRLLRASGYDVAVYESAAELLQRLATEKACGCIVLDMVMPGISGRTVKDHLKRLGSTLPVVFMTGSDDPVQGGPEEVLIKPILKEDLLDAIERALGIARAAE